MQTKSRPPAKVVETAYAKVNLSLDVLGLRPDGYHELRSVMQTVSLHDSLAFQESAPPRVDEVSSHDYSLIDRAILQFKVAAKREDRVISHVLVKRIPVAAGLGGGSSDAAAALRGANRLLGQPLTLSRLTRLAAALGSDVPFFVRGGTALVEGRGERIVSLQPAPLRWFVLVGGDIPVSTARVFEEFHELDGGDGTSTDRVLESLRSGGMTTGRNDLWRASLRAYPEIDGWYAPLAERVSPERVMLSGSGGTFFSIFETVDEARHVYAALRGFVPWAYVASSVGEIQFKGL
ncbi:MAG TPA: 4-(cytidine 5'-diphospho)-2-C-methyl-D-erythritol kinase [Chloroflexota bacterium]|nr:4-(cytidine 5'-diphospho)-2-C-methyl-D-erythritol kinase [Chloroflexota bacterium]